MNKNEEKTCLYQEEQCFLKLISKDSKRFLCMSKAKKIGVTDCYLKNGTFDEFKNNAK